MEEKKTDLKRGLGLFAAICMMTGCIVGASVFVVPGELSVSTGPTAWLSYLIGAVLISFCCFVFARVGSVLPVPGANYMLCTGSVNGTWGFMYVWSYFLGYSFLFPIMAKTAATYLAVFFPVIGEHIQATSIIIIIVASIINMLGSNLSAKVQNACVVLLVAVVLIFSFGGIVNADWSHFSPMFPNGVGAVVLGAISTYYAFAGVNCIIDMSGEIKNPGKNIPRTVSISLLIIVVMYVGMCVGLVGLLPTSELAVPAPAITASETIFPGWFSYFISLAAIAACYTTLNAVISAMSRVMFVLGKSRIFPTAFAKTNKFASPYISVMILAVIGILMVLFSATIMQYVNISSFYLLLTALLVAVASLKIKTAFAKQYEEAEFKLKGIWFYVWPGLAIVSSIIFMVLQFTSDFKMTLL